MYNLDWIRIIIKTNSQGVEAISYALWQMGLQGVEIEDFSDIVSALEKKKQKGNVEADWDYIDESLLQNKNQDEIVIKAYLAENVPFEEKLIQIQEK